MNRPRPASSKHAPPTLEIRPALPSDLAPLTFFFDSILRRDYFMRRGQLEELVNDNRHRVLLAELDALLVGVVVLTRGARLVNALIHPAYRGLSIGSQLIAAAETREVRAKCDMSTGNPVGFYQQLGFQPTGQQNAKGNIKLLRRPGADGAA